MASEFGTAPSMASPARQTARGRLFVGALDGLESWLDGERDQLFLWLPVALGAGVAAWFLLPDAARWLAFIFTALGIAAGFALLPAGGRLRRAGIVATIAMALGCALIWARAERVAAPRLDRPVVTAVEGRVVAVDRLAARDLVRLTIEPAAPADLPTRIRVNVATADMPDDVSPGSRVALRARLMPPPGPAVPGSYDFARVAWFQGLGATGRAIGPVALAGAGEAAGIWPTIMGWRANLSGHVQGQLAGSEGGIAAALATGDQGGIAEADAEAMRRSGLAHLLSISGLHVTAVIGATMLLVLRLLALSPALALRLPLPLIAAAAGAVAGIGYTLLAGAEVPTVRSCIAALLVLIGIAMGRDAITLRLVAAGALIVLLLWPEALVGASFQLSFAAVTAIVAIHEHPGLRALLARREEGAMARWARALGALVLTGLAVEVALAPIALFHFHKAGLYGALANVVAIPLTTFVIMPFEALALLLDLAGLGAPAWWIVGKALALLLWLAHLVAGLPGAVAALPSLATGAFALMVGGGLWIALWRTRARRMGILPLAAGAIWAVATPAPDLLITGDGRHVAIREADGRIALLRPRAGDYVRDMLGEAAGTEADALAFDDRPNMACGPDLCRATLRRDGRDWTVLATRSPYLVDIAAMNRACATADIVISDRRLPRSCRPRWLKADRSLLARTGGIAIHLDTGGVRTVQDMRRGKPWAE
ncbi:competence protein ComEC [Sphingomonas laterariae]|uniref:Competence protein ComEC n=1 Tax=Edaphosphingomonas laterariae TaxID=861865 RepID=A0A239IKZ5_9SPHN|nr:ComEC/Rec2 family competence protein [Sphingomonas laterariae]SNS93723.1 competence protein ComEC [Sphingomonas laterariae]